MRPRECAQSTEGHRNQSGGIFTSPFASIARQDLRAKGAKEGSVNYPRGAGSDADCAPHSAGNRGTPEGQDRALGEEWLRAPKQGRERHFKDRSPVQTSQRRLFKWHAGKLQEYRAYFLHLRHLRFNFILFSISRFIIEDLKSKIKL